MLLCIEGAGVAQALQTQPGGSGRGRKAISGALPEGQQSGAAEEESRRNLAPSTKEWAQRRSSALPSENTPSPSVCSSPGVSLAFGVLRTLTRSAILGKNEVHAVLLLGRGWVTSFPPPPLPPPGTLAGRHPWLCLRLAPDWLHLQGTQ